MVAAMDAVSVDGAVLVSPFSMYRYDASYALEVYAAHPNRFRLVKPVDPADAAVVDVKLPRFRGVLASLVDHASVGWTSIACS
jgi:hypothetical protein